MLSEAFNKTFTLEAVDVREPVQSGKGMMPAFLETPNDPAQAGILEMTIALPNAQHGVCEIQLDVSVTTDSLGVSIPRDVTRAHIEALRQNWQTIRQDVIDDAFSMGEDVEHPLETLDKLMQASTLNLYEANPGTDRVARLAFDGDATKLPAGPAPAADVSEKALDPDAEQHIYAVRFAFDEGEMEQYEPALYNK